MRPRMLSTVQTVGAQAGEWCPFGSGDDQAGDQQDDDARSLVFDSSTLPSPVELLGAPALTIVFESDKPVANLIVRLCDVLPTGESLRLSFGALNLAHRDGHEFPRPLEPGRRYQVRIQLNDLGAMVPAGHKIRLALSTTYWSMIWPAPEVATLTIFSGTLELPRRTHTDSIVAKPFEEPETASPEMISQIRPGVERIDRIGLEIGTEGQSQYSVDDDDPLSAVADIRRADTVVRGEWKVRIETHIHVACTLGYFQVKAQLRAWEDETEVCSREWSAEIPRDLM
jgi:predicted acyl esterase